MNSDRFITAETAWNEFTNLAQTRFNPDDFHTRVQFHDTFYVLLHCCNLLGVRSVINTSLTPTENAHVFQFYQFCALLIHQYLHELRTYGHHMSTKRRHLEARYFISLLTNYHLDPKKLNVILAKIIPASETWCPLPFND